MKTRQDIIREYINRLGPDVAMLEIGVDYGDTWHHQRGVVVNYTGVDISLEKVTVPMDDPRSHWFEMDSRDFWRRTEAPSVQFPYLHEVKWSLIYIDGCHDYEFVKIDLQGAIRCLSPGGYILAHDMIPKENPPYQAWKEICLPRSDLLCYLLDEKIHRYGMGVCQKVS